MSGFAPNSPTVTPPTDLPSPYSGEPAWSGDGKFVTAWPDMVITATGTVAGPSTVTAYAPDGTAQWRYTATPPESLNPQTLAKVMRLADKLFVFWSDRETSNGPFVTYFTIIERSTGKAAPAQKLPEVGDIRDQVSMDSFQFAGSSTAATAMLRSGTVGSDGAIRLGKDTEMTPSEAGLAFNPDGLSRDTVKAYWIDSNHIIRQSKSGSATSYQLVSGNVQTPKALGPAVECADSIAKPIWSPSGKKVAFGQAVGDLGTGKVTCLAPVAPDTFGALKVVGDDGSGMGEAFTKSRNQGWFAVNAAGKGTVTMAKATLPVALLSGVAVFPGGSGDSGIVAYKR